MEKISKGIVFSEDIKRILNGVNAFEFQYEAKPSDEVIDEVREGFRRDVNRIFNNNTIIISEEDMMRVNNLIGGGYPHRNFG